ncbi:TetR/AcrR family transcriptional regulator [Streptomyces sp. NBC_01186]|uniref:TetR/AcrR family transcriptional regulator n=1 Tax=Streptomyces sp. NBC_01186 TaxID=2903765 RepID=UPI002E0F0381|nr:TetR/AcrR family transcriptional regulator [Streptomyces sp. NBC_01186]
MAKRERPRTGLPAGVEAAWGLRERPGRGPARGLDVTRIVTAAIGIADAEGLAALSMSRVAAEVGVSAMALYRYVESKDDLLILMEDAAIGPPQPGPDPERGWRAGMEHWTRAHRAVLRQHLWVVRIPIGTPPLSPHGVGWMEQALAYLRGTGLPAGEKLGALMTLNGYVRSNVSLLADIEEATRAEGTEWEDVERRYWRLLAELTASGPFPAIKELLASGELEGPPEADEMDGDFEFGMATILDGVAARIRTHARDT